MRALIACAGCSIVRAFTAEVMGMKSPMLIALAVLALVVMPANTQAQKIHTEITADTTIGNRVAFQNHNLSFLPYSLGGCSYSAVRRDNNVLCKRAYLLRFGIPYR
jgi:hypothetical protein